ncbi:MAG: VOC family protein, partial [Candidatus Rokuibacteriota bacterium]
MAVNALLHYALEVPDPRTGETFYTSFGLVDEPSRDSAVHLRPAALKQESVLLYPGPKKRLHHLAFAASGDAFEATREALRRAGVPETDPPPGAPEGGLWIRDPEGNAVNIRQEAAEIPPADPPLTLNSP